MIHLHNISKSYGGRDIIHPLTESITKKRTTIVGPNGSGKTTLLSIISGEIEPDDGEIIVPKGKTIHTISQHAAYSLPQMKVSDYLKQFEKSELLLSLIEEEKKTFSHIEKSSDEKHIHKLHDIREQIEMEELKSISFISKREIIENLSFSDDMLESSTDTLSGGWRIKLLLAAAMIKNPDILLFDEPTNYLDIESISFLLQWIKKYTGFIVTVSHDYEFLDSVGEETWEIFNGNITKYSGNYSFYIKDRVEKRKLLEKKREKQLVRLKELSQFIEKFKYKANTATRAQSAVKEYNKLKKKLIILPPLSHSVSFHFPQPIRGGDISFSLDNIHHSYDGKTEVISSLSRIIKRGEKIALVGRNGMGKSTLINILSGALHASKGTFSQYKNSAIVTYRQHEAESLPSDITVIDFMYSITPFDKIPSIRSILASFLFTEDSLETKIGVLSGGEKVRLALLKLLMIPATVLLFDEPTTHLDIESRHVLLNYLKSFPETVIFVSHDSHFIENIADSIIYFEKDVIVQFPGKLSEYVYQHKDTSQIKIESKKSVKKNMPLKNEWLENKKNKQQINKLKKTALYIEKEIEKCEEKIKIIENDMMKSPTYVVTLATDLKKLQKNIDKLYLDWDNVGQEIEKLTNLFPLE